MATKAQLTAQLQQLELALLPFYAKARALAYPQGGTTPAYIVYIAGEGQKPTEGDTQVFTALHLPLPAPNQPRALIASITEVWQDMQPALAKAATVFHELYPDNGMPFWEIAAIMIAVALTYSAAATYLAPAATATGGAAGASGAGGAAAGGAAAGGTGAAVGGGVTLQTISTAGATTATAGAVTTPIVAGGGASAAAAAGGATALSSAGSAGSIASAVGSGVTKLTGSTVAGDVVSSAISGIGSLITDIENILKPVTTFAQQVLSDVETINKDYIVPITTTVGKDYTTITGLIGEIHTLSSAGIQGILAIPSAISTALTSIDAANQRLAAMNAAANQQIATETLVPGIGGAISSPLADIHGVLNDAFNQPVPQVGQLDVAPLEEADFAGFDPAQSQQQALDQLGQVKVLGPILVGVIGVWKQILQFVGYLESWVSFSAQAGRLAQPIEPIGIGETIKAWWRGQMTQADAVEEIKRHGVEPTRAQLLYDLEQWLPGIADAVKMFYQGILTSQQVSDALTKQGLSAADIEALLQSAPARVDPRVAIALDGRGAAAGAGFLQGSLTQAAPDQYKLLYPPRLEDAARAQFDWQAHWDIRDISWWATAYFRGLATADEFKLAAQAHNIAPELIPNLVAVEQETIQLWMIPDMIASNLFTADEAASYLAYIGIAPRDAQLIIQYGQSKANAGVAQDALGLASLSLGLAAEMYADGIINGSEYTDVLEAHKMTPEAAALTVKLTDQKNELAARRATARGLIKQVDAGGITLQAMQSQLYAAGYTQNEVNTYSAEAEANQVSKAKVPTEAEVKAFLGAGIIDNATALATLKQAGWSDAWANAFLTLWGANSASTPTGG